MSGLDAEAVYRSLPAPLRRAAFNLQAFRLARHRYSQSYRAANVFLQRSEAYDATELRNYQDERLRLLVEHAYTRSRHYRESFDEIGLRPGEIRGVADLYKIPILERASVQAAPGRFMTADKPRRGWISGKTSGTSGSALKVWYDRDFASFNNAVDRRQKRWAGMSESDSIGVFLGRMIVPTKQRRPPYWQVNHVRSEVWFSAFHITAETLSLYAREIEARKLRFLEGYPSILYLLAQQLIRKGRTLPMRAVLTSSETLHEAQRRTLERAFECPIFDFYGQAERVIFATECPEAHRKHLVQEYGITEVVDEHGAPAAPGAQGYLVGTSLQNLAFPMLRYRMSDVASVSTEACSCGRPTPVMADVATRLSEFVLTNDGRTLPPLTLSSCFFGLPEIERSQLIQETREHLRILLVPGAGYDHSTRQKLGEALEGALGYGMEVSFEEVAEIPPSESGKFHWVISRLGETDRAD